MSGALSSFKRVVELVAPKLTFDIVVDCSSSLEQMIKAGKYDWVNDDITAGHFPVKGNGKQQRTVILFHFNKTITSEEVIAEMDKEGFLPASIEDILALGESQPELQKQFSIVALVSVWRDAGGVPGVPCLVWGGVERGLSLGWFAGSWPSRCHFLAVCK